jgi:hypothetical protein
MKIVWAVGCRNSTVEASGLEVSGLGVDGVDITGVDTPLRPSLPHDHLFRG